MICGHDAKVASGRSDGELGQASPRQSQGSITRVRNEQGRLLQAEAAMRLGYETNVDGATRRVVASKALRVGQAAASGLSVQLRNLELFVIPGTVQTELKGSSLHASGPSRHRDRLVSGLVGEHNATKTNRSRPGGNRRLLDTNAAQGRG